jgi:hypothetical protein
MVEAAPAGWKKCLGLNCYCPNLENTYDFFGEGPETSTIFG